MNRTETWDEPAFNWAEKILGEKPKKILPMKKGMTNHSYRLFCDGEDYILRVPGEGTAALIDRKQEYDSYRVLEGRNITDEVVCFDPDSGYRLTKYRKDARVCDSKRPDDVKRCIRKLKLFHDLNVKTDHVFDLYGQIDYYESLRDGKSRYADYEEVKMRVRSLRPFVEAVRSSFALTHLDPVPDNFLIRESTGEICLIDWEYAAMQDVHADLAMFAIYSFYDREQIDELMRLYFEGEPSEAVRTKIYCYVAIGGLLWSNWCEYKAHLGVEFGEYARRQYEYAAEYSLLALERIETLRF